MFIFVEAVEAIEAIETIEAIEVIEAIETIEAVEAIEAIEAIETIEAIGTIIQKNPGRRCLPGFLVILVNVVGTIGLEPMTSAM